MRNLNKFMMFLTSAVLLVSTSCQKDDKESVKADLKVSGGTTVVVKDKDAEAMVIITASAAVTDDVTVTLAAAPANGEATFPSSEVVIAKGSTSATTKIVFPLSKFPKGAPQVKITVTGKPVTPGVTFSEASTDFYVSGDGGAELPTELTITAKSTTIDTRTKDGVAELTFALNKMVGAELDITYTYGEGKTLADADMTWNPTTLKIAKGSQLITAKITVPKGKEGKLPIKFAINNADVTLKTTEVELTFVVAPFPEAPVALCALTTTYKNYMITKTFTVGDYTLSPEHNLNDKYGVDNQTGTITANVSNGSILFLQMQNKDNANGNDKYGSAMWVDWDRNGILEKAEQMFLDVKAAGPMGALIAPYDGTVVVPEGTIEGKYFARIGLFFYGSKAADIAELEGGCGNVDSGDLVDICLNYVANVPLTASLAADGSTDFIVVGTMEKTVTVKLSKKADKPITVNLALANANGATLKTDVLTIPVGSASASTQVIFNDANYPIGGSEKFVDVIATSSDAKMNPQQTKITYSTRCLSASGTLTNYCKVGTGSPTGNTGYAYASAAGGSVGGVTLQAADISVYNQYIDYSQDASNRAKIQAGSEVKITFLNDGPQGEGKGCGMGDTFEFVVLVDWNKDGDFADVGEKFRKDFTVTVPGKGKQELSIMIPAIPANAQKISTMRIFTNFVGKKSMDGCQLIESGTIYDVAYTLD